MGEAIAAYGRQDYPTAATKARSVLAALAMVTDEQVTPLPATYKVRLIPARRDCLWRIAEYPFIYNDPLQWPVIYEANKKTFRDPGNPNLIFPGQVLKIPSIDGETREGAWDPATTYPAFSKKK
jgi:nucleoid-associated protein YgaU